MVKWHIVHSTRPPKLPSTQTWKLKTENRTLTQTEKKSKQLTISIQNTTCHVWKPTHRGFRNALHVHKHAVCANILFYLFGDRRRRPSLILGFKIIMTFTFTSISISRGTRKPSTRRNCCTPWNWFVDKDGWQVRTRRFRFARSVLLMMINSHDNISIS